MADAVIFAVYAYAWDVRQDFDLWDCSAQINSKFLRDELIYESKVSSMHTKFLFIDIHFVVYCDCTPAWLGTIYSFFSCFPVRV